MCIYIILYFFFFLFSQQLTFSSYTMARVLINTTIVVLISCCLCLISAVPIERRRFNGPHKQIKGLASKGKLFSGAGTFYEVGSGSCGEFDTDSDLVVAVNQAQMKNGKFMTVVMVRIMR